MKPTVGRIVLFHPVPEVTMAAIVAHVHSDTMVNLAVFDGNGKSYGQTSVQLVAPGQAKPEFGFYCEWMPHQVEQADKADSERGAITISNAAAQALDRIILKLDEKIAAEE
jgi:hypothetical protein